MGIKLTKREIKWRIINNRRNIWKKKEKLGAYCHRKDDVNSELEEKDYGLLAGREERREKKDRVFRYMLNCSRISNYVTTKFFAFVIKNVYMTCNSRIYIKLWRLALDN